MGIGCVFYTFALFFKFNSDYLTPILAAKMKAGLVFVLFAKITSISQFILKRAEISKITSMISNDFNTI